MRLPWTIAAIAVAAALTATEAAVAQSPGEATALPTSPLHLPILGDRVRAALAQNAIVELELSAARVLLEAGDATDAALAMERGRLAIYAGDYDGAAALFAHPDLANTNDGAELGDIARGCARGMAATVEVRDEAHGVVVRLQDDDDQPLVILLADVASRVRAQLAIDLGVELPKPVRIDLVRDQFTLAATTGLPEQAAQTTGTVAIAKWGRVTMLSPRATPHGYPWLDTLAHEMTHLALSRGTADRAPLWLQEGVAKIEEKRWRPRTALDDVPSVDDVARVGFARGMARPLDKLGPSIAMLPSAGEAAVAFAEVTSFLQFFTRTAGEHSLPRLVARLKSGREVDDGNAAIKDVSGDDLAGWNTKWRAYLSQAPGEPPPDLVPGSRAGVSADVVRESRLGALFLARGHHAAAAVSLDRAQRMAPADAALRALLADALLHGPAPEMAAKLVARPEVLHSQFGRWWSLHGRLFPEPREDANRSFGLGVALDPLTAPVACEDRPAAELPEDPFRRLLCAAVRSRASHN